MSPEEIDKKIKTKQATTFIFSVVASLIIVFTTRALNVFDANREKMQIEIDKKVDKTEYNQRWASHEEADDKEFQVIIKMLDGLDKKTDRIEDRINKIDR